MRSVESIDDLGFDPSAWRDLEAVLASASSLPSRRLCAGLACRGDLLCDLDIRREHRLDLVGIGGPKVNSIIGTLVGEGDFVRQSGVDGFSVEIVDKLANIYFGHRNPLRCVLDECPVHIIRSS